MTLGALILIVLGVLWTIPTITYHIKYGFRDSKDELFKYIVQGQWIINILVFVILLVSIINKYWDAVLF